VPKDPVTGADYSYSVLAAGTNFSLSAKLDDGRTLSYDSNGSEKYTGTKKDLVLRPTPKDYNGTNIYEIKLYSYEKISYSLFFAVSDKLAVVGFSDVDSSIKEILDFQKKPSEALSQNSEYKAQFESVSQKISSLSFIEPINVWGFIEYLTANYPQYREAASSYSGTDEKSLTDIEKATKGFLRTMPSIGSYISQKEGVSHSNTLIIVKELPSNEKKEAQDALERLLQFDNDNNYRSVLGVNTQPFSEKVKASLSNFYQDKVRAFISPSLLSN
jgi:hypothetical protein